MTGRSPGAWVLAAALGAAAVLAGCGVPVEDTAHVIADDDLPFGLAGESTTTTIEPSTDFGLLPTRGADVVLYFYSEQGFIEVTRELSRPFSVDAVVEALAAEPPAEDGSYRSSVGPEDVRDVEMRAGVATVELDKTFLDLPNVEQRLAVAQLVLTLTAQPGVGQVVFVIGEDTAQIPRADNTLTNAPVSRDDFIELLAPA